MQFISVCSGIEAASVAGEPVGFKALALSEIEAFPRAVLKHHYPDVPLHGDFTLLRDQDWIGDAGMLIGGTPCQAFSIAGLRKSLSDDRGNLSLEFVRLADAIDDLRRDAGRAPAWILWENVPGVFSVDDNAFGAFLAGLVGSDEPIAPRGRWTDAGVVSGPKRVAAWRVLDAQFFGLAQRRRRVFVLAREHPRGWECADALLPIIDSLSGHPAPRREGREGVARPIASSPAGGSGYRNDADTADNLIAGMLGTTSGDWSRDNIGEGLVAASFRTAGDGAVYDEGDLTAPLTTGTDPSANVVAYSIMPQNSGKDYKAREVEVAQPVMAGGPVGGNQGGDYIVHAIQAGALRDNPESGPDGIGAANYSNPQPGDACHPLAAGAHPPAIAGAAVRRLTPTECEALQGFPAGYTAIPWRGKPAEECPDGPRYKALGNSFAVPVVRYIFERIAAVEAANTEAAA